MSLFFIYNGLVKKPLIGHLPAWLNARLHQYKDQSIGYSWRYFVVIIVCLLIGAVSHLFWDAFTHPTGYFVNRISTLTTSIHLRGHSLYIYKIGQHGSTIAGLSLITYSIFILPAKKNHSNKPIYKYWLLVITVATVILLVRILAGVSLHQYGTLIVTAISGVLLGIIISSIVQMLSRKNYRNFTTKH